LKVAIYIGSGNKEQGNGSQVVQLSNFAYLREWEYEIFSEAISCKRIQSVKENLLLRLRRNEFGVLLLYMLSDWASIPTGWLEEINMLCAKGIRVISLNENFDSSTMTGKLYLKMLSIFTEFEQFFFSKHLEDQPLLGILSSRDNIKRLTFASSDAFIASPSNSGLKKNNKTDYDLIDLNEACILIGYSKHTLYQLTSRHMIPFIKRQGGRKLFFSKKALQNWFMTGSDSSLTTFNKIGKSTLYKNGRR